MSSIGMKLIASVLDEGSLHDFTKIDIDYLKPTEKIMYDYVEKHLVDYGSFPSNDTIGIETGLTVPAAKEPVGYYLDKLEKRYFQSEINTAMMQVQSCLHEGNPHEAMQAMIEASSTMLRERAGSGILDFRDAKQLIKTSTKKKLMTSYSGMPSSWPYLDVRMGGLEPGDLMSIIGRPAQGKTFLLLYMAYNAWLNHGYIPLIVTPEMKPSQLIERLTAMHTHSPLTPIANAQYSSGKFEKVVLSKMGDLKGKDFPMYIVDGAKCQTIEDLYLLCRQLKPNALFYDGAYLMKSRNKRLSKWERIAESALSLKYLSNTLEVPTVASYQFNKIASQKNKKKDNELPSLDDIYGSDEIAQLSSIIVGLLDEDTVESVSQKKAQLLKGRGGEKGMWEIKWDFFHMDFSEILPDNKEQKGKMIM